MQENKQLVTTVFVLIIGLLGGYMIAQHTGHAAESHKKMHEEERHGMDDHHEAMPSGDMPMPDDGGAMEGEATTDIHVQ